MSTVYAPVPGKVDDILMDEDEFKQMLGISAENAESIWGHQKIDETLNSSDGTIDDKTFNEVIKTIDFDDLLETMSDDSPSQSNIIPNIEDSTSKLRTDFSNTGMLMSQRDPMISHGSMTITGGADLKITTTPVLLEQRICQDSTYNKDMKKCEDKDIKVEDLLMEKDTKAEKVEERKENRQIQKKEQILQKESENVSFSEKILQNLPIFVVMFMAILLIFNLIAQSTVELSPFALTGLAMASTISSLYLYSNQYL